ncbi:MAG: hypothetical protein Q8Q15_01090 [bacterium]|nr:hypothetical protein [bacterium]
MSWSGKDWILPWACFCFLLWVGLTLVVYQRVLWPAEWFQQAETARFTLMFLNLWVTEFAAAGLFILVGLLLTAFGDEGPKEREKGNECSVSG